MRASGILLPVFSLPGKYGIGCFSEEAYRFVDFLKDAGQKYWQILPLGPTGYGDSPYQSFSSFAGNPYFIDPDELVREGLLMKEEAQEAEYQGQDNSIDYGWLYETRLLLLGKAFDRWKERKADNPAGTACIAGSRDKGEGVSAPEDGFIAKGKKFLAENASTAKGVSAPEDGFTAKEKKFLTENAEWLYDYGLFMALKETHGGVSFREWEEPLRMRNEAALEKAREELRDRIDFHIFLQLMFERQWSRLRAYANSNGISIIGDIPIYVPEDSMEVWAYPELFQLDENGRSTAVAGCPPDGFSAIGQLWGNPLYNWEAHRRTGYAWWIARMRRCSRLYDVVRIDHFRGFDQYYAIPADSEDARTGAWQDGPGIDLFRHIEKNVPGTSIIAEDLGYITDTVRKLVRDTGYPNMKVLEFAFDSRDSTGKASYLPHTYEKNCVVYTGTHDNETLMGWLENILPAERQDVREYVGLDAEDETKVLTKALVRTAIASVAETCIIPMQDWLFLGNEARINKPSTTGQNWIWRMREDAASKELAARIRKLSQIYGR